MTSTKIENRRARPRRADVRPDASRPSEPLKRERSEHGRPSRSPTSWTCTTLKHSTGSQARWALVKAQQAWYAGHRLT
jgi:hypothetical protein